MPVPSVSPAKGQPVSPTLVVVEGLPRICVLPNDKCLPAEWVPETIEGLVASLAEHLPKQLAEVVLFVDTTYSRVLRSSANPWSGHAHELTYYGEYSPHGVQSNLVVPGSPHAAWLPKFHIVTKDCTERSASEPEEARKVIIRHITSRSSYGEMILVLDEELKPLRAT